VCTINKLDKLRALPPHWIEHNREHATDYVRWAEVAEDAGQDTAAVRIRAAIELVAQANDTLQEALDALGGQLSGIDLQEAQPLAQRLRANYGFVADLDHLSIPGLCQACTEGAVGLS
jgi:hypothetical protein